MNPLDEVREVRNPFGKSRPIPGYGASKQVQGEYEVQGEPSLSGIHHLHFLFTKGKWEWVLRTKYSPPLCDSTRCRMVTVEEWPHQSVVRLRRRQKREDREVT